MKLLLIRMTLLIMSFSQVIVAEIDYYCQQAPSLYCYNFNGVCSSLTDGCTPSCIEDNKNDCCQKSVCCEHQFCNSSSMSKGLFIFLITFGSVLLFLILIGSILMMKKRANDTQKQSIQQYNNNLYNAMQQQQVQHNSINQINNQVLGVDNPHKNQSINQINLDDSNMNSNPNPQQLQFIPSELKQQKQQKIIKNSIL